MMKISSHDDKKNVCRGWMNPTKEKTDGAKKIA